MTRYICIVSFHEAELFTRYDNMYRQLYVIFKKIQTHPQFHYCKVAFVGVCIKHNKVNNLYYIRIGILQKMIK